MERSKRSWFIPIMLYIACILFITLFSRAAYLVRRIEVIPFWSVLQWIGGSTSNGRSILLNILLLIPLGYLLAGQCKRKWKSVVLCFCVSLLVELLQFLTLHGIADVDDLIFNTMGGALGVLVYSFLPSRFEKAAVILAVVVGIAGSIYTTTIDTGPIYERQFYFSAKLEENVLSGQCYIYDEPTPGYQLIVNGKMIATETERDYRTEKTEEGEIFVRFSGHQPISTSVFIRDGVLKYTAEDVDIEGVSDDWGLMAYNEEYDVLVYQDGERLVWLIGTEIDEHTEIIYHIHTDEPDKLPENRQVYGFDNRGFRTGRGNELDPIGHYRVFVK